jgi:hypothetical protein
MYLVYNKDFLFYLKYHFIYMQLCQICCCTCSKFKNICDFFRSGKLTNKCKGCIHMCEKINRFKKMSINLSTCSKISCPCSLIGSDKRLLRLQDDGNIVCLGCYRNKKRTGKRMNRNILHVYFEGKLCIYCCRVYDKSKLHFDYFELVNNSLQILNYSKVTDISPKRLLHFLQSEDYNIVCIQCARDHLTSYLR